MGIGPVPVPHGAAARPLAGPLDDGRPSAAGHGDSEPDFGASGLSLRGMRSDGPGARGAGGGFQGGLVSVP